MVAAYWGENTVGRRREVRGPAPGPLKLQAKVFLFCILLGFVKMPLNSNDGLRHQF